MNNKNLEVTLQKETNSCQQNDCPKEDIIDLKTVTLYVDEVIGNIKYFLSHLDNAIPSLHGSLIILNGKLEDLKLSVPEIEDRCAHLEKIAYEIKAWCPDPQDEIMTSYPHRPEFLSCANILRIMESRYNAHRDRENQVDWFKRTLDDFTNDISDVQAKILELEEYKANYEEIVNRLNNLQIDIFTGKLADNCENPSVREQFKKTAREIGNIIELIHMIPNRYNIQERLAYSVSDINQRLDRLKADLVITKTEFSSLEMELIRQRIKIGCHLTESEIAGSE